jgi:hypothetical protein
MAGLNLRKTQLFRWLLPCFGATCKKIIQLPPQMRLQTWRAFHHIRTVSWQMSMPRSNSKSSTFRSDSGKRTYIMTTSRITSGEELKHRNGEGGLALDLRGMANRYQLPRRSDRAPWSDVRRSARRELF